MQKVTDFLRSLATEVWSLPTVVKLVHTFWQSFLAVWLVGGFKLDKVTLAAAVAAGLSAVKTAVVAAVKVSRS